MTTTSASDRTCGNNPPPVPRHRPPAHSPRAHNDKGLASDRQAFSSAFRNAVRAVLSQRCINRWFHHWSQTHCLVQ